jgi:hypothetical protein
MPPEERRAWARSRARLTPALVAFALALVALACTRLAHAWTDVHVAGDEVRISTDGTAVARVEHRIRLHVSGGPLSTWDLRGVDSDAEPEADGYAIPVHDAASGTLANAISVEGSLLPLEKSRDDAPLPLPTMRLRFGSQAGLPHGAYVVLVRYRTNLGSRGLFVADGATAKLRWTAPTFDDGFDNARVTFDLPVAATPPKLDEGAVTEAAEANAAKPPTFLANARRVADRDEIELLRPYTPKGDVTTWTIRVDAKILARPAMAGAPMPTSSDPTNSATATFFESAGPSMLFAMGGGLLVIFALVVAWKSIEAARVARQAGATARPLVAWPMPVRALAAGLCFAAGVVLELVLEDGTMGALFVFLAVVFSVHRPARWSRVRRGPGKWLPVREAEAFRGAVRPRGASLDVSTRTGKVLFVATLATFGATAFLVARLSPYHAWLVGFDAVVVLAIFGTGTMRELPPDALTAPAPMLQKIAKIVTKKAGEHVRVVPKIRVPNDSADADELRLAVVPRKAQDGFVAIEIGMVYLPGVGTTLAMPEVLLRVRAGSACEALLGGSARRAKRLRGRRPDEVVFAFTPILPTAAMTAAAAIAIASKASRHEVSREATLADAAEASARRAA